MDPLFELRAQARLNELELFIIPEVLRQAAIASALASGPRATRRQRFGGFLIRLGEHLRGQPTRVPTIGAAIKE